MFNIQKFTIQSLKDILSQRRTERLLKQAELEESLKRESFLVTSVNLQQKSTSISSRKLEQSWAAPATSSTASSSVSQQKIYVPPRDRDSALGFSIGNDTVYELNPEGDGSSNEDDVYNTICTVFWKLSLTMNQYRCGDQPVDFGSLWPDHDEIQVLLLEAYQNTPVRRCVMELTRMVLRCGPLRVLKALLDLNVIGEWNCS